MPPLFVATEPRPAEALLVPSRAEVADWERSDAVHGGLRDSLVHALVHGDTVGVAVVDRALRYLVWNRFMERLTGLAANDVVGRDARDVHPHLRGEHVDTVLARVMDGETVHFPDRVPRFPGGRMRRIRAQCSPHRGVDGAVVGVVCIVRRDVPDHPHRTPDGGMDGVADRAAAPAGRGMETDLRRAVERGEVTAHYQPVVALDSGRVAAVEALARWHHPLRGWIAPGEFVPPAEATGLIMGVGRGVLARACRDLRAWSDADPAFGALAVSVNLSVRQFAQRDLIRQVRGALDEAGVAPARLRLEVTESVLMEDADAAAATLARLRALGVRIWMDDFGTGWSSLALLHRLPLDGVKVDRAFVAAMDGDGGGRAARVVASIVALADGLGLEVVAEGIERVDQRDALRALGCGLGQGFLFSPAVSADAVPALLAARGMAEAG